jgi:16S rRNA (uracil1498-N3)-methyltransferase
LPSKVNLHRYIKGGRADWLVEKCAELGAAALVPLLTERSAAVGRGEAAGGKAGKGGGKGGRDKKQKRRGGKVDDDDGGGGGEDDGDGDLGGWGSAAEFVAGGGGGDRRGREGRWERVAAAASKQCLRTHHLRITQPMSFDALVQRVATAPVSLLAAAGAPPLREVLAAETTETAETSSSETTDEDEYYAGGGILIVGPEGDFTDEEVAALVAAGAKPVGLGPLRLRVETAAVGLYKLN